MNKSIITAILASAIMLVAAKASAQETIAINTGDITSPKLNNDGTATFS